VEPNREIWEWLTELTGHEKDPAKRLAIVREIDRLLEERENDPKQDARSRLIPHNAARCIPLRRPNRARRSGERRFGAKACPRNSRVMETKVTKVTGHLDEAAVCCKLARFQALSLVHDSRMP